MRWIRTILVMVTLGLLAYILTSIDFKEVYNAWTQLDGFYLFLAFVSYLSSFLIFSFRNLYFFEWLLKPGYWFLLENTFAGFFLNTVTPGAQVGGEPARAYALGVKYDKPISKTFGVIFADKVVHILSLFFFIIFSIIYLITFIPLPEKFKFIFQALLFIIFIIFVIIPIFSIRKTRSNLVSMLKTSKVISWMNPFKNNPKLQKKIGKHFSDFTKAVKRTLRDKKVLIFGIVLSAFYWFSNYLVSYFIFLSLGIKINFLLVVVVFSLVNFTGVFFPTPGGTGFIETLMIFLYSLVGVNLESAIIVSLLTRVIFYFYAIVIGGISLIHLESSIK